MRRLPPLNPLRVFEAAARFGSFNRAAEHLHVTASAVSHQIKTLEQYLGIELFRRSVRQVTLTATGRSYLPPVRDALEQIAVATEQVLQRGGSAVLTVSTAPAFGFGWLVPRLMEFNLAHPDIEVRLDASVQLVDFDASDVDVCIRSSMQSTFPGLRAHRLFTEDLIPVCSPDYAAALGLEQPADLRRATLLHAYARMGQWRSWLTAAGVDDVDPEAGQKFTHDAMSIEAAAAGAGVAIAIRPVVERQLHEGRLVALFDFMFGTDYAYYLVYPLAADTDPKVESFRDWLLAAVACADTVETARAGGDGG